MKGTPIQLARYRFTVDIDGVAQCGVQARVGRKVGSPDHEIIVFRAIRMDDPSITIMEKIALDREPHIIVIKAYTREGDVARTWMMEEAYGAEYVYGEWDNACNGLLYEQAVFRSKKRITVERKDGNG